MIAWFIFGFMCALVIIMGVAYLKFVSLNKAVKTSWLRLDNTLKNRAELIPNLSLAASSVEGLDKDLLANLKELKDGCRHLPVLEERVACEAEITRTFKKIFAAADASETLKKEDHFIRLQKSIMHSESQIQYAKKKYNSAVRDFNTLTGVIPLNIVANLFEFDNYEYFDFDSSLEKLL